MELSPTDNAKFMLAKGLITSVENTRDKSVVIENTVGIEFLFTLLANGIPEKDISDRLKLTREEFRMIVTASPALRKRFMQAKAFALADKSEKILGEHFGNALELSKEEKSAADFHSKNIDRILAQDDMEKQNSGVVVNNMIVVRNKNEMPALPPELEGVFDANLTLGTDREEERDSDRT